VGSAIQITVFLLDKIPHQLLIIGEHLILCLCDGFSQCNNPIFITLRRGAAEDHDRIVLFQNRQVVLNFRQFPGTPLFL
jgi:hypothetical protein